MRRPTVLLLAQWLRFAAVGGTNTLLSLCLYALLEDAGAPYAPASALAFTAGALNSFLLNRRWTFRSHGPAGAEAARFAAVQVAGLGLDVTLLVALVEELGVQHLLAQALVFPVASAVTFALSRQWAFAVTPSRARRRAPGRA